MNLFNYDQPLYKIKKPIRLIELFAGYGSQSLALKYLGGVEHSNYKVVEFDEFAIRSYNEIHGTNFPTLDITEIKGQDLEIKETDKYEYIMTYSFPCQDLSLAGKGAGMGKGTRSGLLWEVERLLNEVDELPQILLMENVPQVIGSKNIKDFSEWVKFLEDKGYSCYWQNLIATDYGIPQTRNRTFMVSILGKYRYTFPKPIPLELKLEDMLEDNVEESYYLSDQQIKRISRWNSQQKPLENIDKEKVVSPTLTARGAGEEHSGMILINEATLKGYAKATAGDGVYINRPHQKRGVVQKDKIQTLKTSLDVGVVAKDKNDLRIRKLTPREAFRLMGVKDEDYEKLTCSNSQKYKQAGNSIVVNVLMAIFKELL